MRLRESPVQRDPKSWRSPHRSLPTSKRRLRSVVDEAADLTRAEAERWSKVQEAEQKRRQAERDAREDAIAFLGKEVAARNARKRGEVLPPPPDNEEGSPRIIRRKPASSKKRGASAEPARPKKKARKMAVRDDKKEHADEPDVTVEEPAPCFLKKKDMKKHVSENKAEAPVQETSKAEEEPKDKPTSELSQDNAEERAVETQASCSQEKEDAETEKAAAVATPSEPAPSAEPVESDDSKKKIDLKQRLQAFKQGTVKRLETIRHEREEAAKRERARVQAAKEEAARREEALRLARKESIEKGLAAARTEAQRREAEKQAEADASAKKTSSQEVSVSEGTWQAGMRARQERAIERFEQAAAQESVELPGVNKKTMSAVDFIAKNASSIF